MATQALRQGLVLAAVEELGHRCLEAPLDVALEPGLLVEPTQGVAQEDRLSLPFRVGLEAGGVVRDQGRPEGVLPPFGVRDDVTAPPLQAVGSRLAGAVAGEELVEPARVGSRDPAERRGEGGEGAAELAEHLPVAGADEDPDLPRHLEDRP